MIEGGNGQGKSNLLEAIYLLAIGKSQRASADRELVRWNLDDTAYSQIAANILRDEESVKVQIDLAVLPRLGDNKSNPLEAPDENSYGLQDRAVQKHIKINGIPRRISELVGQINVVLFTANDLELVYGAPYVRRRYLDILISQVNPQYLRASQNYQKVVYQRNHLLKMIREGKSYESELEFWDNRLVTEGSYIMIQRLLTIQELSELAAPLQRQLTSGEEGFSLIYHPSVKAREDRYEETLAGTFQHRLHEERQREIAQGVTVVGPHRDDFQLIIQGMDAGMYASRGQARTTVLAMKLGEASYMKLHRKQEPVLLLDDLLSELDEARRVHVLDKISQYQQCFITTADVHLIADHFLTRMSRYMVRNGCMERLA